MVTHNDFNSFETTTTTSHIMLNIKNMIIKRGLLFFQNFWEFGEFLLCSYFSTAGEKDKVRHMQHVPSTEVEQG